MTIETNSFSPELTELEQLTEEQQRILTKTAVEQDLLDGGNGKPIYTFTKDDAWVLADWGEVGAYSDRNIAPLFNTKK